MGRVLFVIGFPRSGTKLLLQLLRTHPEISGAGVEVNLAHQLSATTTDEQFREMLESSTLWVNIGKATQTRINTYLQENTIQSADSLENFYTGFVRACDEGKPESHYVVDKSPRYIIHGAHLLKNYPNARFIHIVRDVRAVAKSHNKVWGKNIYRVADQWNKSVTSFFKSSQSESRVLELRYEDLVDNPESNLDAIATFLGLSNAFDFKNVSSNEVHGKAVTKGVVKNADKDKFSEKQQRKIEALAFNGLTNYAYPIKFASAPRQLPFRTRLVLFAKDHLNLLQFHIKEKGLIKGSRYYIRLIR
jgi:hypothetical protein